MRYCGSRGLLAGLLLLTFFAVGAWADDTLTLQNSVYTNYVMGGVYTSPYEITVNGTLEYLVCDDFTFNIPTVPYTWNATEETINTVSGSNARYASYPADYAVAAYLTNELLSLGAPVSGNAGWDSELGGQYSYAIWDVFDTGLLQNNPSSGEGALSITDLVAADNYLIQALNTVTGSNCAAATVSSHNMSCVTNALNNPSTAVVSPTLYNYTVYTPDTANGGNNSQEFIGTPMSIVGNNNSMPAAEPSYPAILGIDLLAVLGVIVAFRRRLVGLFN